MTTTFMTPGLRCGGCAANIRAALSRTPGVRSVDVTVATKRVEVAFDPAVTSAAKLAAALAAAGYPPADGVQPNAARSESTDDAVLL